MVNWANWTCLCWGDWGRKAGLVANIRSAVGRSEWDVVVPPPSQGKEGAGKEIWWWLLWSKSVAVAFM